MKDYFLFYEDDNKLGSDYVDIVDLVDLLHLVAVDLNCLAYMYDEDGDEDSELGS